jgi:hypothetical protein
MKLYRYLLLIAFITIIAAPPASADWNFAGFASWYDSSDLDASAGGGVKCDWLMGETPWGVELRATYFADMGADVRDWLHESPEGDIDVSAMPMDLGVNYHFLDNENLYLGAGLSYIFLDVNDGDLDNEWGWYAVLGYMSGEPTDGWAFFGEFMYRVVEGTVERNSLNPESFDVGIEGYGFNVGVAYRF